MKQVLLIQNVISSYRVPVYNQIAKEFDLTLLYSNGKIPQGIQFKTEILNSYKRGPFSFYNRGLHRLLKQFDVVVFPYDPMQISLLSEFLMAKLVKGPKFIPWGIGVPASYNVSYDAPTKSSKLFYYLARWSDASIFYSDYPKNKYISKGVLSTKLFVAHNTVEIYEPLVTEKTEINKNSILFVGSLYKQKGLGVLLDAYKAAKKKNSCLLPLYIIGGGDELPSISKWIKENNLNDSVFLEGPIYDEKTLSRYFLNARACISPNQAGLSVQKSLGYGVPFITKETAITGGEIFDIINDKTGILYKDDSDLVSILLDINDNSNRYYEMGQNGKKFYNENRTIKIMAQGAIDAINYVL